MTQPESTSTKSFRVIVVGAGIVGLSLSHALQLANIDHVVLEKHHEIVSVRGAALVIWPGVMRIFDQFGILKKIHETVTPVNVEYRRWPDGSINSYAGTMTKIDELFQMPNILFDRQACVTHLYEGLPDKSKIQTSKRLERIEHTETGVRVHLADGTIEEGDMVIGADGVHSTTRKFMWDYASKYDPSSIPDSDKSVMFSQFSGLFGVSTQEPNMNLGLADSHLTFGHDETKLLFTQPGKAYWAVIFKDELSRPAKQWKPTDEEVEAVASKYEHLIMTESVRLGDLWRTKTRQGLLSFEEGVLSKWHAGRIVLVGDSAHKMTADLGLGANIAVESGVYLANILHRELKANPSRHMSTPELSALFAEYQKGRFERVSAFADISGKATRMHTYQTYFGRFWIGYIAPYVASMQTLKLAESFGKAPKLDYAPVRTVDESAEGWKLGERKSKGMGWWTYVIITSTVGAAMAWWVTQALPSVL